MSQQNEMLHTCEPYSPNTLVPYSSGPCAACAVERERAELAEWVQERLDNCLRFAAARVGEDREGWLDDAAHFRRILAVLNLTKY